MNLGVVFVHYRTPELLERSVEAVAGSLGESGHAYEIVVVDNGSSDGDRGRFAELPVRLIEPAGNIGFAAGLNLGIRELSSELLVLMNPDVLVLPECLPRLVDELEKGAGAAGPRFYWDEELEFLLPPTEPRTRWAELVAASSSWSRRNWLWARRRWRRHARRFWLADSTFETTSLSGALLAVRRDALEQVGLFDEGYHLYFEETDWLLRLRANGGSSVHVPEARAVHLYNQSAVHEPQAERWFRASEERFFRRHYGAWLSRLLRRVQSTTPFSPGPWPDPDSRPPSLDLTRLDRAAGRILWIEISPSPLGFPAGASAIPTDAESWTMHPDIWKRLAPGMYYLSVFSRIDRDLERSSFKRLEEPTS